MPVQGYKWGDATLGTSGGMVTWSLATSGLSTDGFSTSLANFMPSGFESEVRRAFQAWEDVADIRFVEVDDASDVNIRLGAADIDGQGGALGSALTSFDGGVIQESRITVDLSEPWRIDVTSGGTSVFSVVAHEIGHALGIGHDTTHLALMFPLNFNSQSLLANDISVARAIYGDENEDRPVIAVGGGAADSLVGGTGDDALGGGDGEDTLFGDDGLDVIAGGGGADLLIGGAGNDLVEGGDGADMLYGNQGGDLLYGNGGADQIFGGQGLDVLHGGQADDLLIGGGGGDVLHGGLGDDVLYGDGVSSNFLAGADTIHGGEGSDTAVYLGDSTIYAFTTLSDGGLSVSGFDVLYDVEVIRFADTSIETSLLI